MLMSRQWRQAHRGVKLRAAIVCGFFSNASRRLAKYAEIRPKHQRLVARHLRRGEIAQKCARSKGGLAKRVEKCCAMLARVAEASHLAQVQLIMPAMRRAPGARMARGAAGSNAHQDRRRNEIENGL